MNDIEIVASIRHKWAEKIYRRDKTAELRKTTPKRGDFWSQHQRIVRIYEPEKKAVTGSFYLSAVFERKDVDGVLFFNTALEPEEIEAYGPGRDGYYHVWSIGWAQEYLEPLPLWAFGLDRPPQSWCYVPAAEKTEGSEAWTGIN